MMYIQIAVADFLKFAQAFDKLKPSFLSGLVLGLALALVEVSRRVS